MQKITLDLVPGKKMPSLHASQFDDGRAYHIDLTENRVPYTLDGTETISVIIRKCDNTLVSMDIANTFADKSYIEFEVVEQMTACSGFNYGEIILEKNGDRLGSLNFYLQVETAPDENGITSKSEVLNLKRQVNELVAEDLADNGAEQTGYDNTESGLEATNVQDAIDELANKPSVDAYTKEQSDSFLADEYDAIQTYAVGDYCIYEGGLYVCNTAISTAEAWNASHWTLTDVGTALEHIPTKTSQLQNDSGFSQIDDSETSASKTYSSNKVEAIAYTKTNKIETAVIEENVFEGVINKNFVFSSTSQFNNLGYTLKKDIKYKLTIKFADMTSGNMVKLRTIRTYSEMTGSALVDEVDFEIDYGSFIVGLEYTVFYTPTNDCNFILFGFDSSATFSEDNVDVDVEDTSIKFASKVVENKVEQIEDSLTKEFHMNDVAFTVGYYMKADGTTASNANFEVSDYFPVLNGTTVTYAIHSYNNVAMINVYNSSKQVIQTVLSTTEQDLSGTISLPANARYIRICRWSTYKNENDSISFLTIINSVELFEELDGMGIGKQWKGKSWHCFGTSISNASVEGKYPSYLVALSGLVYNNFAYSGGRITNQILSMIQSDAQIANADLITVEGFVNDWSQQSPLGNITDTTADSFYGALYVAITYILSHSNATLIFITDSTGQNYNNIDLRREAVRNGKTQNDFIMATIEMCNYMGVPVIDAGRKSNISQDTATLYIVDQIHHTEKGGEQYARTIWTELKNIYPRIK